MAIPTIFFSIEHPANYDSKALTTLKYIWFEARKRPWLLYSHEISGLHPWKTTTTNHMRGILTSMAKGDSTLKTLIPSICVLKGKWTICWDMFVSDNLTAHGRRHVLLHSSVNISTRKIPEGTAPNLAIYGLHQTNLLLVRAMFVESFILKSFGKLKCCPLKWRIGILTCMYLTHPCGAHWGKCAVQMKVNLMCWTWVVWKVRNMCMHMLFDHQRLYLHY